MTTAEDTSVAAMEAALGLRGLGSVFHTVHATGVHILWVRVVADAGVRVLVRPGPDAVPVLTVSRHENSPTPTEVSTWTSVGTALDAAADLVGEILSDRLLNGATPW
jgi:hypothetical protein